MRTPSRTTLIGLVVIGACILVAVIVSAAVISGLGAFGKRLFKKRRLERIRRAAQKRTQYHLRGVARAYVSGTRAIDMHPFVTRLSDGKTIVKTPRDTEPQPAANYMWGDALAKAQQRAVATYGAGTTVTLKDGLDLAVSPPSWNRPPSCSVESKTCSHWDGDDTVNGLVVCPSGKSEYCAATLAHYCTDQPDGNTCSRIGSESCGGECASGVCNGSSFCGVSDAITSTVVTMDCSCLMFQSPQAYQSFITKYYAELAAESELFVWENRFITGISTEVAYDNWINSSSPATGTPVGLFGTTYYGSAGDAVAVLFGAIMILKQMIWNDGKAYMVQAELNPCQFGESSCEVATALTLGTWNLSLPFYYLPLYALVSVPVNGVETAVGSTWVTQGHSYDLKSTLPYVSNAGIRHSYQLVDTTPLYQFTSLRTATPGTITNYSSLTVYAISMLATSIDTLVLETGLNPKLIDPLPMSACVANGSWSTPLEIDPGTTSAELATPSTAPVFFYVNPLSNGGQARFSAVYDGVNEVVTFVPDSITGGGNLNVMPVTFSGDYVNGFCVFDYVPALGASADYVTPPMPVTTGEFTQSLTPGVNTTAWYSLFNFGSRVEGFVCILAPSFTSLTIVNETTEALTLNQNGSSLFGGQVFDALSVTTLTTYDALAGGATLDFGGNSWTPAIVPASLLFDTIVVRRGLPILFQTQQPTAYAPYDDPVYVAPLTSNRMQWLDKYWVEGAQVGFVMNTYGEPISPTNTFYNVTTLPDPTSFTSITVPNNGGPLVFSLLDPLSSPMPPPSSLADISQFPWPTPYVPPVYTQATMPSPYQFTIVNEVPYEAYQFSPFGPTTGSGDLCDFIPVGVSQSGYCNAQLAFIVGHYNNQFSQPLPPGVSQQTLGFNTGYFVPGAVIMGINVGGDCEGGTATLPANLNSFSTITVTPTTLTLS